jgi:uncharacterized protein
MREGRRIRRSNASMLISALILCLAIYLAALAGMAVFQRKLQYFPQLGEETPANAGLPQAQVVSLKTQDGETLVAWYVAPSPGKPLILYFHGNGGGLDLRAKRFAALTAAGCGLLAVEYRGYGASTGTPSEKGLLLDGEAGYAEALALGASADGIVVMGESLGTGVAVPLAARHPVGALVLDSPFSSAEDVAASLYWMFPVRLLMRDRFRSDAAIGLVRAPILMVHGSNDQVTPLRLAEKLYALAPEPKRFIRVEGAKHLALGLVLPDVLAWLDQVFRRPGEP